MIKFALLIIFMLIHFISNARAADQVFFYHTDPVGTPMAISDASGQVVWRGDYKPFGEEASVSGALANDRKFVGKEKDEETGLYYFGARYLDAKIGRFAAVDPVRAVDTERGKTNEELLLNPQRLNTYAYGLNNPYRYVDPDGLWGEEVHLNRTETWAIAAGVPPSDAKTIAYGNNSTDGGLFGTMGVGFSPIAGDQSRHFNTNNSGCDSREIWANRQFDLAVSLYKDGRTVLAISVLGRGLHSLQDKFAHRDWDTGSLGFSPHPAWYDNVTDPRNAQALNSTENATKDYIINFKNAVGYR